MTISVTRSKH